ncbi:hypothetical protein EBR96_08365, partial [bacterium]|nr:hypothetical protein [bacterium]
MFSRKVACRNEILPVFYEYGSDRVYLKPVTIAFKFDITKFYDIPPSYFGLPKKSAPPLPKAPRPESVAAPSRVDLDPAASETLITQDLPPLSEASLAAMPSHLAAGIKKMRDGADAPISVTGVRRLWERGTHL